MEIDWVKRYYDGIYTILCWYNIRDQSIAATPPHPPSLVLTSKIGKSCMANIQGQEHLKSQKPKNGDKWWGQTFPLLLMATNDTSNKLQADGPGCIYHKQNSLLICIFVYPCKCCVCNRNCGCCNQVFFHGEYQIFFVRQRSRVRKKFSYPLCY